MLVEGDRLRCNDKCSVQKLVGTFCTFKRYNPNDSTAFFGLKDGDHLQCGLTLAFWDKVNEHISGWVSDATGYTIKPETKQPHRAGIDPEHDDWDKVMGGGWCGD
jgi:hypothetical protein